MSETKCECGETGFAHSACIERGCQGTPAAPVDEEWPGPLDGVWPEELRAAMNVIEGEIERAFARTFPARRLQEQGRVTDAFTALKAYMRKARTALARRPVGVTEETMCSLRSAIVGRDADDDDRTPRYGMLRVRELVEIHAALSRPGAEGGR